MGRNLEVKVCCAFTCLEGDLRRYRISKIAAKCHTRRPHYSVAVEEECINIDTLSHSLYSGWKEHHNVHLRQRAAGQRCINKNGDASPGGEKTNEGKTHTYTHTFPPALILLLRFFYLSNSMDLIAVGYWKVHEVLSEPGHHLNRGGTFSGYVGVAVSQCMFCRCDCCFPVLLGRLHVWPLKSQNDVMGLFWLGKIRALETLTEIGDIGLRGKLVDQQQNTNLRGIWL